MSSSIDSTQALRVPVHGKPGLDDLGERLEQLNAIGAALSAERNIDRLLENILVAAKTITRADGGTLYRVTDERTLRFWLGLGYRNEEYAGNIESDSSATLDSTTAFVGTIMADQAITLKTGASLDGRALARIAAVTLDSNVVVKPAL